MKKTNKSVRSIFTLILACCLLVAALPLSVSADQTTQYHDPAVTWVDAASRTNELNVNAVVQEITTTCHTCNKVTAFRSWRCPEYTTDGETALKRNVMYSDGTLRGGQGQGTILDGKPGINASYTGYHWTKSACTVCGTINANMEQSDYCYGRNVFYLYDCDAAFFKEVPETVRYEYADDTYHKKTVSGGEYCGFCFGTHHHDNTTLERHDLERAITPQLGNQRFMVVDRCKSCDYEKVSYITAKSVVASYYGVVDGQPHTLTVTDLSESGVTTSIRYGNSAETCTLSSAPNYTAEGQNTVYYEITYNYGGATMTENGVAYVWLRDENDAATPTCSADTSTGAHSYAYLDTVAPTCGSLGYDRYVCVGCGAVEKRNYTAALGHTWQGVVVREATCEQDGKLMEICRTCGEGIMEYWCVQCGYHRLEAISANGHTPGPAATCTEDQVCTVCGAVLVHATGHSAGDWIVDAEPTTEAEGSRHKECVNCGEIMETEVLEKLPALISHAAYIVGYPNGNFGPEDNMTRAEAAAIFARLLADKNGDTIKRNSVTKFTDVVPGAWYAGYVKYLSGYQVIYGVGGDKFAPEKAITRAEFTAMAVRFYREYAGTLQTGLKASAFEDVASQGWAYEAIQTAAGYGWIVGYGDDTFRPAKNISRAEAVSIVNRVVGRTADREYITDHRRTLHDFPDVPKSHWAYWNIMEAANTHTASILDSAESWRK